MPNEPICFIPMVIHLEDLGVIHEEKAGLVPTTRLPAWVTMQPSVELSD